MGKSWGAGKEKVKIKKSEQGKSQNSDYAPPRKNKYKHGYMIED